MEMAQSLEDIPMKTTERVHTETTRTFEFSAEEVEDALLKFVGVEVEPQTVVIMSLNERSDTATLVVKEDTYGS
jgi:hypothetical protein